MQLHIGADHFSIDDLLLLDLPLGGLEIMNELQQDHIERSLTWMQLHIGAEHFSKDDLLVLDLPECERHGEEALPQVGDREVHNENVPEERF
jgi:hypothetical protein